MNLEGKKKAILVKVKSQRKSEPEQSILQNLNQMSKPKHQIDPSHISQFYVNHITKNINISQAEAEAKSAKESPIFPIFYFMSLINSTQLS